MRPFFHHLNDSILQHLLPESAIRLRHVNQVVAAGNERRHNLGKIEAARHNVREFIGTRTWQRIRSVRTKGAGLGFSRIAGAAMRGLLVMFVIATPTILLIDTRPDSQQMVALVALFAGVLTFVEYKAVYPGLFEFRDAPPFNRIRFLMLFATVFCLVSHRTRPDRPVDHDRTDPRCRGPDRSVDGLSLFSGAAGHVDDGVRRDRRPDRRGPHGGWHVLSDLAGVAGNLCDPAARRLVAASATRRSTSGSTCRPSIRPRAAMWWRA